MTTQITQLRKEGKLDEACELAVASLNEHPEDKGVKSELAWVYYAYLVHAAMENDVLKAQAFQDKILGLSLEYAEMLHEAIAWQLVKLGFGMIRRNKNTIESGTILFGMIQKLRYSKPSDLHSAFLNLVVRWEMAGMDWLCFMEKWGWEHFREKDYLQEEPGGKNSSALVEKVVARVARCLLKENISIDPIDRSRQTRDFLNVIALLMTDHPEYTFFPYYATAIKVRLKEPGPFMPEFNRFASMKSSDFWVWDLMADFPELTPTQKLACLCKALSLQCNDAFLVKVRIRIVPLLVVQGLLAEARMEADHAIKTYRDHSWQVPQTLMDQLNQPWYDEADEDNADSGYGVKYLPIAQSLLYQDSPRRVCVVTGIDSKTCRIFLMASRDTEVSFVLDPDWTLPNEGDCFALVLEELKKGEKRYWKVISCEPTEEIPSDDVYREVTGSVSIRQGQAFGFIGECYVSDRMIREFRLMDGMFVHGIAVASFNPRKGQWGWRVVRIDQK
jgi:hypothetical protein